MSDQFALVPPVPSPSTKAKVENVKIHETEPHGVAVNVEQAEAVEIIKVPDLNPHRKPIERPDWKRRRLRLDLALIFLGACLLYVLFPGGDATVDEVAVIPLVAGVVGLIGQYIFGATWDDKNYMNAIAKDNNPYGTQYESQ